MSKVENTPPKSAVAKTKQEDESTRAMAASPVRIRVSALVALICINAAFLNGTRACDCGLC